MENVVRPLYDKLLKDMNEVIEDRTLKNNLVLILYFVVFIIITGFIFIFAVFPLANELKNKFIVTIKLLNIIPTAVISKINSISHFLKSK